MAITAEFGATVQANPVVNRTKTETQYPDLVNHLLALHKRAKQLINGPKAYRSAAFANWKKEASIFFDYVHRFGADFDSKARFHARKFGRSTDILTDEQILTLFKHDMNNTIADFHRLFVAYRQRGELSDGVTLMFPGVEAFDVPLFQAVRRNPAIIAVVTAALVAIASAVLYLLKH